MSNFVSVVANATDMPLAYGVFCSRVFYSMIDFWTFMEVLLNSMPSVDSLCASGCVVRDCFSEAGLMLDSFSMVMSSVSNESDSDVANLADLEAFTTSTPSPRLILS